MRLFRCARNDRTLPLTLTLSLGGRGNPASVQIEQRAGLGGGRAVVDLAEPVLVLRQVVAQDADDAAQVGRADDDARSDFRNGREIREEVHDEFVMRVHDGHRV